MSSPGAGMVCPVSQINFNGPGQSGATVVTLGRPLSSSATLARPRDGPADARETGLPNPYKFGSAVAWTSVDASAGETSDSRCVTNTSPEHPPPSMLYLLKLGGHK